MYGNSGIIKSTVFFAVSNNLHGEGYNALRPAVFLQSWSKAAILTPLCWNGNGGYAKGQASGFWNSLEGVKMDGDTMDLTGPSEIISYKVNKSKTVKKTLVQVLCHSTILATWNTFYRQIHILQIILLFGTRWQSGKDRW